MQLSYRGVKYDYHPPVFKPISSKVIGQYRGAVLKTTEYAKPPFSKSVTQLKYRGISHTSVTYYFQASELKSLSS